jgi:hypothetical protein
MRQCPFCKEMIHEEATRCPKCRGAVGRYDNLRRPIPCGQLLILILVGLLLAAGWFYFKMKTNSSQ